MVRPLAEVERCSAPIGNPSPSTPPPSKCRARGHGSWQYRLELPAAVDRTRRQLRRGGFVTRAAAIAERDHVALLVHLGVGHCPDAQAISAIVLGALRAKRPLPDIDAVAGWLRTGSPTPVVPTVSEYLTRWLTGLHLDTYTTLLPDRGRVTAEVIASAVPRSHRPLP